jgi:hypothetical protein
VVVVVGVRPRVHVVVVCDTTCLNGLDGWLEERVRGRGRGCVLRCCVLLEAPGARVRVRARSPLRVPAPYKDPRYRKHIIHMHKTQWAVKS